MEMCCPEYHAQLTQEVRSYLFTLNASHAYFPKIICLNNKHKEETNKRIHGYVSKLRNLTDLFSNYGPYKPSSAVQ